MAKRNIYAEDVDFATLALQSPAFNKQSGNGQLDFSDPASVSQLTRSLLQRDFALEVDLPDDRLCPPVPNRYNYVLWLQDLIDTTSEGYTDHSNEEREVIGLDIGTGASCIYPLLACSQRREWKLVATDVDAKNLAFAKHNILKNGLKSRIRPLQTNAQDALIPLDILGLDRIDFTMCNPPFYSSSSELQLSAKAKARPPSSACTGAEIEMVTPGGEVAFVGRIVDESKRLGECCQWYTTMLGKADSVGTIVQRIRDAGCQNWTVKDLIQGAKTKRWVVGWSWSDLRPPGSIARSTSTFPKAILPYPPDFRFVIGHAEMNATIRQLNDLMQGLDLRWIFRPAMSAGLALANRDVWSRAARRKKSQGRTPAVDDDNESIALAAKLVLAPEGQRDISLDVRWLQGFDSKLFESFCGMLKRHINGPAA